MVYCSIVSLTNSSYTRPGFEPMSPTSATSSQAAHYSMRLSARETSNTKSASLSAQQSQTSNVHPQIPKLKCVIDFPFRRHRETIVLIN